MWVEDIKKQSQAFNIKDNNEIHNDINENNENNKNNMNKSLNPKINVSIKTDKLLTESTFLGPFINQEREYIIKCLEEALKSGKLKLDQIYIPCCNTDRHNTNSHTINEKSSVDSKSTNISDITTNNEVENHNIEKNNLEDNEEKDKNNDINNNNTDIKINNQNKNEDKNKCLNPKELSQEIGLIKNKDDIKSKFDENNKNHQKIEQKNILNLFNNIDIYNISYIDKLCRYVLLPELIILMVMERENEKFEEISHTNESDHNENKIEAEVENKSQNINKVDENDDANSTNNTKTNKSKCISDKDKSKKINYEEAEKICKEEEHSYDWITEILHYRETFSSGLYFIKEHQSK